MHEGQAKLNYSFGDITAKVSVDGSVDRPIQVVDHLLSTLAAVTGVEVIQCGLSGNQRDEGALHQKCTASVEFGEIKLNIELDFSLKQHVSKRTLNNIVFTGILPKVWETAGIYLGDNQAMTTPAAPLAQKSHRDVLNSIDGALFGSNYGLMDGDGYSSQSSDQPRQRQLATR